jgi:two-component system OmpR family response regulator
MHLLYVTDRQIDAYLIQALRESGHVVEVTDQPGDGVVMAAGGDYQAIVLDWSTAQVDRAARFAAAAPETLVMMIVASAADDAERVRVLKAGVDVCFVRPFSFIELQTRLEALARLVRRARPSAGASAVELLAAERAVRIDGRRIVLSGREFQLLEQLVGHAGEVISTERLQERVWGATSEPRPDLVRTCVSRLRRKLETAGAGAFLRAVAGHGYVFQPTPANAGEAEPAADPR